jgi:hypothetical protein
MTLPLKQAEGAAKLSFTFLGGQKQFIDAPQAAADNGTVCSAGREKERDGSDNANSVVMVVQFGNWRFYDAGDLTWNQEARLVCPKNLIGQVDVYQVTHHGLDSSNNPLVLRSLQPRVAVMNNGVTKAASPKCLPTCRHQSLAAVYQVHKNLPDGATATLRRIHRQPRRNAWESHALSVAADAKLRVAFRERAFGMFSPKTAHDGLRLQRLSIIS